MTVASASPDVCADKAIAPVAGEHAWDALSLAILVAGLAFLYVPTYWSLTHGVWAADSQGHEPFVPLLSAWLMYRRREALAALPTPPLRWPAVVLMGVGLLIYVVGRSQQVLRLEMASQIVVVSAMVLAFKGRAGLRLLWFPLAFLVFVIPAPYAVVLAVTGPLKAAVSMCAAKLLFWAGYPVGRSGVIITIGQYELLVAQACAGLQTMFSLEAMGLLYANLRGYRSPLRALTMALLVVPISFCANVVRVMVLALVTYHFGDEAGRGFIHGFAGMVLFLVALLLLVSVDRAVGWLLPDKERA